MRHSYYWLTAPGHRVRTLALASFLCAGALATPPMAEAFFGRGEHGRHCDQGEEGKHGKGGHHKRMEHFVMSALQEVGATEAQQEQIRTLLTQHKESAKEMREAHRQIREQFLAELAKPTVDRAALDRLRLEGLKLAETKSMDIVELVASAAEILTPEQRKAVVEELQSFRR